jgi:hypothetical protein
VEGGRRRIGSLKVGDRVWTLIDDGEHLIEDEIFCIPHAAPNTPSIYFFKLRFIFQKHLFSI